MPRKPTESIRFSEGGASSPGRVEAPEAGRRVIHDTGQDGLVLVVTTRGTRSWYAWVRVHGGEFEKVSLGRWPTLTVREARSAARVVAGKAARGVSPSRAKRESREAIERARADADRPTLRETFEWFKTLPKRKTTSPRAPRTLRDYDVIFERHLAHLAGRQLHQIGHDDVQRLRDAVANADAPYPSGRKRGGPYAANRTLSLLSAIYNAARRRASPSDRFHHPGGNPTENVERFQEVGRVEEGRGRIPEIVLARLFRAIREEAEACDNPHAADILEVSLLLADRGGRVQSMAWAELELDAGEPVWVRDRETVKQRRAHVVPLPPRVVEILARRREQVGESPWVFPALKRRVRRDGTSTQHMGAPGKFWQRAKERAGLEGTDWVPYCLRHTGASRMSDRGVPAVDIAEALGHANIATTMKYLTADRRRVRAAIEAAAQDHESIINARESA